MNWCTVDVAAAKVMHLTVILKSVEHRSALSQIAQIHICLRLCPVFLLFILQFGDLNAVSPGNIDKGKHFNLSSA